jgi:hypothetical protein
MEQINIIEIIHLFNRMKQINIMEIIHLYSFIYSTIFIHPFIHLYILLYSIIYSIAEFMNETLGNIASILHLGVAAVEEEESDGCSRAAVVEEEEVGVCAVEWQQWQRRRHARVVERWWQSRRPA